MVIVHVWASPKSEILDLEIVIYENKYWFTVVARHPKDLRKTGEKLLKQKTIIKYVAFIFPQIRSNLRW